MRAENMNCSFCKDRSIYNNETKYKTVKYCKNHFIKNFEKKVDNTIKKNSLIKNNEKIVCATSGGKDSLTVLYLSKKYIEENKLNSSIEAIVIDEGIPGYRDKTIEDVKKFCKKYEIKLKIASFKKAYGKELEEILAKRKKNLSKLNKNNEKNYKENSENYNKKQGSPCTTCGILRRDLLNKSCVEKYDKMITSLYFADENGDGR